MSEAVILNFSQIDLKKSDFESQIRDIFFMTSSKNDFQNQNERDAFEWKYLGHYLKNFPDLAWVCIENNIVLGYLVAAPKSDDQELYSIQPHLKLFEKDFLDYPAHLHINCRPEAQGKGIGKKLVHILFKRLSELHVTGVHIMTGPLSENRQFYQKMGFEREIQRGGILFMGARI